MDDNLGRDDPDVTGPAGSPSERPSAPPPEAPSAAAPSFDAPYAPPASDTQSLPSYAAGFASERPASDVPPERMVSDVPPDRAAPPDAPAVPAFSAAAAVAGRESRAEADSGVATDVRPVEDTTTAAPEGTGAGAHPDEKRRGKGGGSFLKELPFLIAIALVLALLIKTFLIQAFYIPSGSMEQTLHGCPGCSGDRVLVNKLVYDFRDVHRGEIVVFKGPESWDPEVQVSEPTNPVSKFFRSIGSAIGFAPPGEKDFIKRVIGVPGDTVACCDVRGRVTVNGHPLDEPYVYQDNHETFGPVKVPAGNLWVMGDHRSQSADSRAHIGDSRHGTIPIDNVIGRAFVIVWPLSRAGGLAVPDTFHQKGLVAAGATTAPYALGVVGALPIAGLRRRRRRRRVGR